MSTKSRNWILSILAISLFANIIFLVRSIDDSGISAINESLRQKEAEYIAEITKLQDQKEEKIKEIDTHLQNISELNDKLKLKESTIEQLQSKFDALHVPTATNFKTLAECNEKFTKLTLDLNMCLNYGKETKLGFDLCMKESNELKLLTEDQSTVIGIQEKEIISQKNMTESVRLALRETTGYYKKKLRKKWISAGGIGIAIGMLAGFLLK